MAVIFKKRSVSLPLVINAGVSSLILALGMTPTFATFTASISSQLSSAGAGTIVMQETDSAGAITCMSTDGGEVLMGAASCSAINKFGGQKDMRPGDSAVVVTNIKNVGTLAAASFSLTPGPCVQTSSGSSSGSAQDLCSRIAVSITSGARPIYSGTAAALGSVGAIDLLAWLAIPKMLPGQQVPFTVTTTFDASLGNAYQGLDVSQPMTWTFSA